MSNPYGYTPEEMQTVGAKLITIQGAIGDQITTAKSAVDNLIGSGFTTGVASGTYASKFQELRDGLSQVNDNLGPLGQFLQEYGKAVVDMDNQMSSQLG
ncbi:MAG: WXG100 family type VII secretion target [Propionibacteriaceae bacterium]|nr:WXG100 family type VII secretion target [Propionibacteriaceae bacterium]